MNKRTGVRQTRDKRQTLRWARGVTFAAIVLAAAPADARRPPAIRPMANPGGVIAAELAFARLAQDKGQWTAFRETAAKDAEMFVPQRVAAQGWLAKQANPVAAVTWQAQAVWSSCDGSYAVTRGAWQRPQSTGYFTTVWRRDRKGRLNWVLDQGDALAAPLPEADFVEGKVADCPARGSRGAGLAGPPGGMPGAGAVEPVRDKVTGNRIVPLPAPLPDTQVPTGADSKDGRSDDGTLGWRSTVMPDMARRFTVWMWKDEAWLQVIDSRVAAPGES